MAWPDQTVIFDISNFLCSADAIPGAYLSKSTNKLRILNEGGRDAGGISIRICREGYATHVLKPVTTVLRARIHGRASAPVLVTRSTFSAFGLR